jgi:hypothetical protein
MTLWNRILMAGLLSVCPLEGRVALALTPAAAAADFLPSRRRSSPKWNARWCFEITL